MKGRILPLLLPIAVLCCLVFAASTRAATVEFLTGEKLECKVLSKDDKNVTVEVTKDGKTEQRTIPLSEVHVVTINTKRYVINPKPTAKATKPGKTKSPAAD